MELQDFTVLKNAALDTNELRHKGKIIAFFEYGENILYLKSIDPLEESWCQMILKQLYPNQPFEMVAFLNLDHRTYS